MAAPNLPRRARGAAVVLASLIGLAAWSQSARAEDKKPDEAASAEKKPAAEAPPSEEAVGADIEKAIAAIQSGKADDAIASMRSNLARCGGCSGELRTGILVTLGMAYGQGKKDLPRARVAFALALREDPSVDIDRKAAGKDIAQAFTDAQADAKRNPALGKGAVRLPATREQAAAADSAAALVAQGKWEDCLGQLSLSDEDEFASGRFVLAQCEEAGGLLLEAAKDAQRALELAKAEGDKDLASKVQDLVEKLDNDVPAIIVIVPASVDKPVIKIDGVEFDKETAKKGITRNPGKATVEVVGKKGGYPFNFKTVETIDRGEKITVDVAVSGGASSAVQACMANAKTAAEVAVCLETGGKGRGLTFKGGLEVTTYNDTTSVDVVSPAISLLFENPTQGWQVSGSALLDVVSAASPDIVATSSRRFDQARFGGTLGGEVKVDFFRVGANAGTSIENDYVGRSVGGRVSADVMDKRLSPTLGYSYGWDTIGISGTDFAEFSNNLNTHAIDAGVSAILTATTILIGSGNFVVETGDQSKPYRHVPMFAPAVAETIERGADRATVGGARLPVAPLEQLPLQRLRGAFSFGVRHRFEESTLRADERLYMDSWGVKASTTEARFLLDLGEHTRVGPHLRFHIQGGADFWQRAYSVTLDPATGSLALPAFRTGDRELGPLFGVTAGGSIRHELIESLALGFAIDAIYTHFLDHIYLTDRIGVFTATTLELEVE